MTGREKDEEPRFHYRCLSALTCQLVLRLVLPKMSTHQRRHSIFRPCIDLHQGFVKQIVGGTLDLTQHGESSTHSKAENSADPSDGLKTNFVAA